MNAIGRLPRSRSRWLIAAAVCGMVLGLTIPARAAEQPIGTVIGVPMGELDGFVRANSMPGANHPANDVRVLHVAPEFNSAIATVAVIQRENGHAAAAVYFPTFGNKTPSRIYRQINADDVWSFPLLIGEGYSAVMKMNIEQPYTGDYVPGKTRFMIVPWEAINEIIAANPPGRLRLVHRQRAHIGAGDVAVALVAVDPSGLLATNTVQVRIPAAVFPNDLPRRIRSLNSNVDLQGMDPTAGTPTAVLEVR
jgi:hypothetical protein